MAKKYHSARAAKGTVNKGAIAIIVTILIAALLLGVAVGVMGYGTSGFKDWGFSRFAHKTPAAYEQHEEVPEETGAAIVEPTKSNGMAMLARQATAEEAAFYGIAGVAQENIFTLSVTYEPEDTTFQETDYSIAFKNPGSEWAQGKNVTDYATLTHSDGSKEATVSVLKAFSEQIIVTASNQKHKEITATTTVDYVCEGFWMELNAENGTSFKIAADSDYGFKNIKFYDGTVHFELNGNVEVAVTMPTLNGFDLGRYYKKAISFNGEQAATDFNYATILHEAVNAKYEGEQATKCWEAVKKVMADNHDGDGFSTYTICYHRQYKGKDYGYVDLTLPEVSASWQHGDPGMDLEAYGETFPEYFEIQPQSLQTSHSSLIAG